MYTGLRTHRKASLSESVQMKGWRSRPFEEESVSPKFHRRPKVPALNYHFSQIQVDDPKAFLQPKLTVGTPGDQYEQEADQVATQIVSSQRLQPELFPSESEAEIRTQPLGNWMTPQSQIQSQTTEDSTLKTPFDFNLEHQLTRTQGSGSPISEQTRSFMESRFGADFSGVRLHQDQDAVQMNQALGAKAFTYGQDIYFNQGTYQPNQFEGQHLLAHELAHVIQQKGATLRKVQQSNSITYRVGNVAPLRDPAKNFEPINQKTQVIPKQTSVQILETQTVQILTGKKKQKITEQEFVKVQWDNQEGWIAKAHLVEFDPTYATLLSDSQQQALAETSKSSKPKYQKDETTQSKVSSVKQLWKLNSLLGQTKTSASQFSDPSAVASQDKLPQGTLVIILDEQVFEEKKYTKVSDLEGKECWVLRKTIQAITDPRIFEELPGGVKGLIKENRLDQIRNSKARAALQSAYSRNVKNLLESKDFSSNQNQLFASAIKFLADPDLQDQLPELKLSEHTIQDGETPLNPELIRRINLFYKFLNHAQVISGYSPSISGARSSIVAHLNSTRWTFSPKSGHLSSQQNRVRMARELVEIDGRDPSGQETWASSAQVKQLKAALDLYDGKHPTTEQQEQLSSQKTPQQLALEEIDAMITHLKGVNGTKNAVCAEGYPRGDSRRKPNINDKTGISLHCGGEAIDITFYYRLNYYDPVVDAIASIFGLYRPVKDASTPEHWHYERLGVPLGERQDGGEEQYEEMKNAGNEISSRQPPEKLPLAEESILTFLQNILETLLKPLSF